MNVVIVYGFLGAGKTSLIRHWLSTGAKPGQIAVLLNDLGQVNIDGALLAGQHLKVLPMASGCICCTLSGAFTPAVEELHNQWHPDWLVIEPTGIAAPYALEDLLRRPRLARVATLASIVTVVHAARFTEYRAKLAEFYTAQVEQAQIVLLNHADQASPEQLSTATQAVRKLNPAARVVVTEYGRLPWAALAAHVGPAASPGDEHHHHEPEFESSEISLPPMSEVQLEHLTQALRSGRCGKIFRAKGIVRVDGVTRLLNFVDGQLDLESVGGEPTLLLVVGQDLRLEGLSRF